MLTAKELAKTLNGRQYRMEILPDEEREAKESGLVVIFGCSDDLVELRGAIDDEVGAYGGTVIFVGRDGKLLDKQDCDNSECPYYKAVVDAAITVEAHNGNPCWTFEASIPYETFSIFEDEELFCEGIVFSLENAKDEESNNPLTLEELREMDGEPVWIERGEECGYGILLCNSKYGVSISGGKTVSGFLAIMDYGETWLAYRHRKLAHCG